MELVKQYLQPKNHFDVDKKLVIVAGGSRGLGKAMAMELAAKGANILLLARNNETLSHAKREVEATRASNKQIVDAISVDLTKPDEIHTALNTYPPPDILICTAGGTPTQTGFLADIPPSAITTCLELNYYTAIFIVQYCLMKWLGAPPSPSPRHIVLTSSIAAFVGLPGYIAYTPTKVAIRALADTLRQELLLYRGGGGIKVHVSFPGTFISESFLTEQEGKPELLKVLEGTDGSVQELQAKMPSSRDVARKVVAGVERGKTYIPVDFEGELLLNNMRGPSPRFFAVWDYLVGVLGVVAWWVVRLLWERRTRQFGRREVA